MRAQARMAAGCGQPVALLLGLTPGQRAELIEASGPTRELPVVLPAVGASGRLGPSVEVLVDAHDSPDGPVRVLRGFEVT